MSTLVDHGSLESAIAAFARTKVEELSAEWADRARRRAPRRSGHLADSIEVSSSSLEGSTAVVHVTLDVEYARWQDEGTGIYGPRGERIVPVTAKALRFEPQGGGVVFAKSVKGSPATRFWTLTEQEWPAIVREVAA